MFEIVSDALGQLRRSFAAQRPPFVWLDHQSSSGRPVVGDLQMIDFRARIAPGESRVDAVSCQLRALGGASQEWPLQGHRLYAAPEPDSAPVQVYGLFPANPPALERIYRLARSLLGLGEPRLLQACDWTAVLRRFERGLQPTGAELPAGIRWRPHSGRFENGLLFGIRWVPQAPAPDDLAACTSTAQGELEQLIYADGRQQTVSAAQQRKTRDIGPLFQDPEAAREGLAPPSEESLRILFGDDRAQ